MAKFVVRIISSSERIIKQRVNESHLSMIRAGQYGWLYGMILYSNIRIVNHNEIILSNQKLFSFL